MEENKNVPYSDGQNTANNPNAQGGRRKRHKKKGGNGGQALQNEQKNTAHNATAQTVSAPSQPAGQKQAQKQPQNHQNRGQKQNNKSKNQNKNAQHQSAGNDNRKDTYVYTLDGNLYINLTNKCSNGCDFCVRNERASYYGNYLWLKNGDPTPEKVIAQANGFGDLSRFKEVVFCGFGEPTYRVNEMTELCDYFHGKGLQTRLNTNGQGNLINKRDIVPELKGKLDFVNVSLNASCAEKYQPVCRSQFGESGFTALVEFAKECRKNGIPCRFSIVDCIGETEVEACKRLAESVKIPLYIRKYIADS